MRVRGWLSLVVLTSCASSFPKVELQALPGAKDHAGAKWVVLLDEHEARFGPGEQGPEVVTTERWRIKVLEPTEVPAVVVQYSRTFEDLVSIRGRIISPEGVETPLDTSKLTDWPGFSGSVLFTDSRVARVVVPPVPVGGVFESEVVIRHRDMQHFTEGQYFGGTEPIERARFVASTPRGWTVGWKAVRDEQLKPVEADVGDRHTWTFERTKLAALERETEGPSLSMRVPRVAVRLETWTHQGKAGQATATPEALSRELWPHYDEAATLTPELRATVKDVLTGVEDTPEAKARALYEFVCRTVQYCAVEIGFGGWYPHPAKDVQAARYGDCKDKATYLHALLTAAGVRSAPTLIYAHDGVPRDFLLPSLGANFNHAILSVLLPDRTVFVDPTHRAVPFGELPASDQGAPVLPVSKEGSPLGVTPESTAQLNVERQQYTLTLRADGEATGRFHLEAAGARAQPWKRKWIEGTGSAKAFVQDQLWLKAPLVEAATRVGEGDFSPKVELDGTVTVRRVSSDVGDGRVVLRPVDLFASWFRRYDRRAAPMVASVNEARVAEVTFELPEGSLLLTPPRDVRVEGPAGVYRLTARLEGRKLLVTRSFERTRRVLPVGELDGVNRFAAAVFTAETEPLLVSVPKGGLR